jgi:hypothetical protein
MEFVQSLLGVRSACNCPRGCGIPQAPTHRPPHAAQITAHLLSHSHVLRLRVANRPSGPAPDYVQVCRLGALKHVTQYDSGSVFTIDIMLDHPSVDFVGGEFTTPNGNFVRLTPSGGPRSSSASSSAASPPPPFSSSQESPLPSSAAHVGNAANLVDGSDGFAASSSTTALQSQGDAIVFVSHKHHNVQPVVQGTRHVLVVELWEGEGRTCGHRCERSSGVCDFKTAASLITDHLADFSPEERAAALRFLKSGGRF